MTILQVMVLAIIVVIMVFAGGVVREHYRQRKNGNLPQDTTPIKVDWLSVVISVVLIITSVYGYVSGPKWLLYTSVIASIIFAVTWRFIRPVKHT